MIRGGADVEIVNLTAHQLTIERALDVRVVVPPSGTVARCRATRDLVETIDGIPVYRTVYGAVEGIPEPRAGVVYVASVLAARAAGRPDVLSPGEMIRDGEGRPVACLGLSTDWPHVGLARR